MDFIVGFSTTVAWTQLGNILTLRGTALVAPVVSLMGVAFGEVMTLMWAIDSGLF